MRKTKPGRSNNANTIYSYWCISQTSILKKKTETLELPKIKAFGIDFIGTSLRNFAIRADEDDLDFFYNSTSDLISKVPAKGLYDKITVF